MTNPLAQIKETLQKVLGSGQKTVDVGALLSFIQAIERDAPLNVETAKLQHESRLAQYRAEREIYIEMLRSVLDAGKAALNSSILINGGAAAALLALIGNLYGKSESGPPIPADLVYSLVAFASGVLLGGLATAGTYLTQYCYTEKHRRTGTTFHVLTVLLVLGSYGTFGYGVLSAYRAFNG